jgi:hypothetical protein
MGIIALIGLFVYQECPDSGMISSKYVLLKIPPAVANVVSTLVPTLTEISLVNDNITVPPRIRSLEQLYLSSVLRSSFVRPPSCSYTYIIYISLHSCTLLTSLCRKSIRNAKLIKTGSPFFASKFLF